jgi:hypothetical protein
MYYGTPFVLLISRSVKRNQPNPKEEVVMRNLIGMSVLAAMMLIPGSASTAQAGASVSVSVGLGTGYSTYYDADMDWDNVLVLDDSRIGFWVMLPSGRWVLRIRNMWWNAAYEEWCFGPWYYDYSIVYNYHSHNHFFGNCGFHPVWFHMYMSNHYRPWHERHFYHQNGRYVRRIDNRRNAPTIVRQREPARVTEVRKERSNSRPAVIVRESKPPVRIDGGNRPAQIENKRPARVNNGNRNAQVDRSSSRSGNAGISRSQTTTRESGNRTRTVTKTETRRDGRKR